MSKPKPKQPAKQAKAVKKAKVSAEPKNKKSEKIEQQPSLLLETDKITAAEAKAFHEQAKGADHSVTESFVTLGRALAPIRLNALFIRKELGGYKNFEEYVEAELTGLDVGQAYRAIQLHEKYSDLATKFGIDQDKLLQRVAEIGVSKALMITKLIDEEKEESLEKWLGKAEEETVEKLSTYLKKRKGKVDGQDVKIGTFKIRAQDEQIANIEYAVNEARQILGLGKEA